MLTDLGQRTCPFPHFPLSRPWRAPSAFSYCLPRPPFPRTNRPRWNASAARGATTCRHVPSAGVLAVTRSATFPHSRNRKPTHSFVGQCSFHSPAASNAFRVARFGPNRAKLSPSLAVRWLGKTSAPISPSWGLRPRSALRPISLSLCRLCVDLESPRM